MIRVVVCCLIVLATASFKPKDTTVESASSGLLSKIEAARKLVKDERVQLLKGTVGTRRVRVGRHKIKIARAIKRDEGFEVITPGFVVSVRRENGINTDFACIMPAGGKVLAVKYPVSNEGNRFGAGDSVIEAVYTPYSAEIKTEEVVKEGIEVQEHFVRKAYSRIKDKGVLSYAFPGRKVADVIPADVLQVLLMNEHIDPGEFKSSGLTRALVERVLTVIAANKESAYSYSVSSAGARGLVQMIPSTYSLIASKYPTAGLMKEFSRGMADPVNAVMAQILLCDSDWQAIRTRNDIPAERVGPYLAAAYNGGVGRVLSMLAYNKTEWMEEPDANRSPTKVVTEKVAVRKRTGRGRMKTVYVSKSYSVPIFRNETSKYVSQYHWISDYFASRSKEDRRQE
jgi:Transglycosylase SLT domain